MRPSQSDITKVTSIEKMTLSKAIVRLEELLLVRRVKSEVDTRTINVSLTRKSKKLIPHLVNAVESIDNEIFGIKNTNDKALFTKILVSLNEKSSTNL